MIKYLLLASTMLIGSADAQPYTTTTVLGSTISVTNTFQNLLAAGTRRGCLFQNQGTHTMYVDLTSDVTIGNSAQVAAGGTFDCNAGNMVIQGALSVTGTAGDAYIVWSQ